MEKVGSGPESATISDSQQSTTKFEQQELPLQCDLNFKDQCKIVWEGVKKGFKYDGCTAVPDFDFGYDCCGEHDTYYQDTDCTVTRAEADKRLRECLRKKGYFALPWAFWLGVRLGGWMFWRKRPKIPTVQVQEEQRILPQ